MALKKDSKGRYLRGQSVPIKATILDTMDSMETMYEVQVDAAIGDGVHKVWISEDGIQDSPSCPRCKKRGKTWNGGDPICAFQIGRFSPNNWMCATMNDLRELASRFAVGQGVEDGNYRNDDIGSFGWIPFEGEGDIGSGFLCLSWYKDRGTTGSAIIIWDDVPVRELSIEEAEYILSYHERRESRG